MIKWVTVLCTTLVGVYSSNICEPVNISGMIIRYNKNTNAPVLIQVILFTLIGILYIDPNSYIYCWTSVSTLCILCHSLISLANLIEVLKRLNFRAKYAVSRFPLTACVNAGSRIMSIAFQLPCMPFLCYSVSICHSSYKV